MRTYPSLLAIAVVLVAGHATAAPAEPHVAMPMLAEPVANTPGSAKADFATVYAQIGRPRIAIYYNRELSGQLEEWITPVRQKTTQRGFLGEVYQAESYTQFRDFNEAVRANPDERWSWAFEDGFYTALLNEKVRLIDRTAILRLAANDRPEADNKDKPDVHIETIPLKRVEVDALKHHADLVVEVLVAQSGDASNYEFKAKVMEIKTGRLLAMVNQVPAAKPASDQGKFVAGQNGYEREQQTAGPDDARAKGERLADEVMHRLARVWRQ